MNRIFIILSLFLVLFTRCTSPNPKESTLKVPVNVTKHLNTDNPKDSTLKVQVRVINKLNSDQFKDINGVVFYSINIDLINNTDSIIHFWIYSNDWVLDWIFNTHKMYLSMKEGRGEKNVPVLKQIEPGNKITYHGILCIENTSVIKNHSDLRLGFVLIKKEETSGNGDFHTVLRDKIKKKKDIIWSDAFKIKE
jgi:hypothetical protein